MYKVPSWDKNNAVISLFVRLVTLVTMDPQVMKPCFENDAKSLPFSTHNLFTALVSPFNRSLISLPGFWKKQFLFWAFFFHRKMLIGKADRTSFECGNETRQSSRFSTILIRICKSTLKRPIFLICFLGMLFGFLSVVESNLHPTYPFSSLTHSFSVFCYFSLAITFDIHFLHMLQTSKLYNKNQKAKFGRIDS